MVTPARRGASRSTATTPHVDSELFALGDLCEKRGAIEGYVGAIERACDPDHAMNPGKTFALAPG